MWKCGKIRNDKNECRYKKVDKGKGFDYVSSIEGNNSLEEGGDVYLASSSTHTYHDVWLIGSIASFHTTPHRELFCEYEK